MWLDTDLTTPLLTPLAPPLTPDQIILTMTSSVVSKTDVSYFIMVIYLCIKKGIRIKARTIDR